MATRRSPQPRNGQRLIVAILIVVGLGSVVFGIVQASGYFGNNKSQNKTAKKSREGMVAVPKSLVNLRAFEKVRREDVYNLELGDDSYYWLPKAQVAANPQWKLRVDQVIGRVMARNKGKDFVFKEADFLPEGSRTGLMGGVPVGKQGFFLNVDQIPGLRYLKKGDRFDLLVNLPVESEKQAAEYGLLMGGIKVQAGKPIPVNGIRVLARAAELIALTTDKTMTTQGGLSLQTKDKNGRDIKSNKKEERVLIAISPQESVPLTDALGKDLQIHAVIQSGQKEHTDSENQLNGMVAFPANAIKISAYTKITASDLAEPASGNLRQYYFNPDQAKEGWIANVEDLIGKVVNRDIEPGYIFSSSDFLGSDHVSTDVDAYQRLSGDHLSSNGDSKWIGKVAAVDMKAGDRITQEKILSPGSLMREVKQYQTLSAGDLVESQSSTWIGKVVSSDLSAGHKLAETDVLPVGSLTQNVKAFQRLTANDLVGRSQSDWVGRVSAQQLNAGQLVVESMLLAKGARPGVSSAIPKGRFAMTLSVDAVDGFGRLSNGDRIDVLETRSFDLAKALGRASVSEKVITSLGDSQLNKVVASDVLVVDRDESQVVLAVKAKEVSSLTKALSAEKNRVTAIARSNSANSKTENPMNNNDGDPGVLQIQSDPNPLDSIIVTKLIIDGEKSEMAFRRTDRD